jgi:SCP-2 sterol transfer family
VIQSLARVGFDLLGSPRDDAEIPPERLVLALHASFRPEAVPGLSATYQLELGDESFAVSVQDGQVEVAHGTATRPDLTITTDSVTLSRVLQGESGPDVLETDGPARALARFVEAFAWRR